MLEKRKNVGPKIHREDEQPKIRSITPHEVAEVAQAGQYCWRAEGSGSQNTAA